MSRLKRKKSPLRKGQLYFGQKFFLISSLILLLIIIGGGYWYKETLKKFQEDVCQKFTNLMEEAGLTLENIFISGRSKVTHAEILSALGVTLHTPMVFFNMKEAHARLESLPWVQTATIERHWPDTLFIHLAERIPLALWQDQKQIYLVDKEGVVISEKDLKDFMHLPSITGPHAARHLPKLLHALSDFPEIQKCVVSATWVGDRRWNIHLDNKVTLMLPEHDVVKALHRFRKYEQTHKLSQEARKCIDLRIPQRIIIE